MLLIKRGKPPSLHQWSFPGGSLELGRDGLSPPSLKNMPPCSASYVGVKREAEQASYDDLNLCLQVKQWWTVRYVNV